MQRFITMPFHTYTKITTMMLRKILLAGMAAVLLLTGCVKDKVTSTYVYYRPVYKTKATVRSEVKSSTPRSIQNPGKLFYKDGYVFLNELDKGVHIIDIKDVTKPKLVSFVAIPGCVDLAVRGNTLYADLDVDLVAIDISDPLNTKITKLLEGVFPHRYYGSFVADSSRVIVDWLRVDTTVQNVDNLGWGMKAADFMTFASVSNSSGGRSVSNGVGGSMARFALSNDRLYTVSYDDLKIFNTAIPETPSYIKEVALNAWDIETIYPFQNKLFLGASTGMHIVDISNKDNPVKQGTFTHARVCDPVVTDGKYAYVTLRNGTQCGGFINQLDVVNVENVMAPSLVKSFSLFNPHGLAKDGNLLLICDGADGLKVMDATQPNNVYQLGQLKNLITYDVIALDGIALVSAKDGLHLVDYRTPSKPTLLSSMAIGK